MRRRTLAAATALLLFGCAHHPKLTDEGRLADDRRPPAKVATEEDYSTARADFDALDVGDPGRRALRDGMAAWAIVEARHALDAGRAEAAWELLHGQILPLWDADELRSPPPNPALSALALDLERIYRKRGAHLEVLTALAVQIALSPTDADARARWDSLLSWLEAMPPREPPCDEGTCLRVEVDLEAVVQVWPSRDAIDRLGRSYLGERPVAPRRRSGNFSEALTLPPQWDPALNVTRLYLRTSRPEEALAGVEKLVHSGVTGTDQSRLRQALARFIAKDAKPVDAINLAAAFFEREPAVAQRVCRDAARRFPDAVEPQLCLGDVATKRLEVGLAIASFEKALVLAPARRDAWEALARLRQERLSQLVGEEKVEQIAGELRRVEQLHADAARRFPGAPLHTSLAGAFYEVGRGHYNTGKIAEATQFFTRSVAVEPTVEAIEYLGTIQLKQGNAGEALPLFIRAESLLKTNDRPTDIYWRAKLRRGIGDVHELLGGRAEAEEARKKSASNFGVLLWNRQLGDGEAAEAEVELGKVLYQLGDRDHAITAFQRAVDRKPERGSTYADVLAFLVPRGEIDEATDVYHRAMGRAEITEYLKVYCTLWIIDLDRRAGRPEDPLGRAFLDGLNGTKWYHDLARFSLGRTTEPDLDLHAKTPPNRAEYYFYLAMRRAASGQLEEAKALWRKVLATEMMAFFEYDMASYYLRNGASLAPPAPKTKPTLATPEKIPDGSI